MMKKYIWWIVAAIVVFAGVYFGFLRKKSKSGTQLIVNVVQGDFEVLVTVTGELQAKNFENISGPDMRSGVFRITELRIQDMVAEGTIVDSGDFVAELDRSSARNAMLDIVDQIDVAMNRVETMALDTTVQLKGLRDQLLNMTLSVEEAKIRVEQSIFEPPATQRQAQIDADKAERALEQAQAQYGLREQVMRVNMMDATIRLERLERQYHTMQEILSGFTIRAPRNGMVIYRRDRSGQKRRAGSTFGAFDNVVATLPDLSVMISRTYVNEIDISKVRVGQEVRIGVDAFPDKRYTGEVVMVADIGEQLANTDAKVFEVIIEVNESDPIMRPSMTTSNAIEISTMTGVTFVSIDAIYSEDSIPYVYTTSNTRQVVVLGEANENEIIVEHGLSPGDRVYVSTPENSANWKMVGEELIPIIKQRALDKRREQEEQERRIAENRNPRRQQWDGNPDGIGGGGGGMGGMGGGAGGGGQRQPGGGQPGGGGQWTGGDGGGGQRGGGGGTGGGGTGGGGGGGNPRF